MMKARIFNITQYVNHPITGELLLSREQIEAALKHKSIKRHAYALHNKDSHIQEDVDMALKRREENPDTIVPELGAVKPPHWHVVLQCRDAVEVETIAKWFDIPAQYIDIPKGRGSFLDCVRYLTHEDEKQQALGKYRYPDEEIIANFDFRAELDKCQKGKTSKREEIRLAVSHGLTIRQLCSTDEGILNYLSDKTALDNARAVFLANAPLPLYRLNFYVEGKGGIGKGLMSHAIAHLFVSVLGLPEDIDDEDLICEIGGKGVSFDKYDGQPIIIWNDKRAGDFVGEFGRNIFNIFDPFPKRIAQHKKYGNVTLLNAVNIVNAVEPYSDFLNGLAGEYQSNGIEYHAEDIGQAYRRFPLIIHVYENDYDLMINKGIIEGTREFTQYYTHKGIIGNLEKIHKVLKSSEMLRTVEQQMISPIAAISEKIYAEKTAVVNGNLSAQQALEFANYGKTQKEIIAEYNAKNTDDVYPF
ncbi:MAG: replication protein [Lachnospiraceae bacterium]|nr:replication protein [Ruminococcus sp.]MCM1275799.1 replication protein [Lachnospiraceae bacterium]